MALVFGRKPFGAKGMSFGEPGGTFGNMWENGEPQYDLVVSGGNVTEPNDGYIYHTFTISGVFSVTSGETMVEVFLVAGGGSGGWDTDSGTYDAGGGGGYAAGVVEPTPAEAVTVTVGAGGENGTAGGTSSFGAYLSATGGGTRGVAACPFGGITNGGAGSGGDVNGRGGPAGTPYVIGTDAVAGGSGGNSHISGGRAAQALPAGTTPSDGLDGQGPGAGGAGSNQYGDEHRCPHGRRWARWHRDCEVVTMARFTRIQNSRVAEVRAQNVCAIVDTPNYANPSPTGGHGFPPSSH